MGLLSASSSFTRFRIIEDVPAGLWQEIPGRLKRLAIKDIDDSAEERSFGWVSFEDMLDTQWRTAPPEKGAYLAFAMRLDTRRISAAVLKKHLQMAMAEAERQNKEQGKKYISRDRKKEIKEQVRLKLMARSLPIPAVFDVAWNIQENTVYFGSTRAKVCDLFTELFTDTFELHLEPMTPYFLALSMLGEEARTRLDNVEPTRFL
jgi:hypothetical protein